MKARRSKLDYDDRIAQIQIDMAEHKAQDEAMHQQLHRMGEELKETNHHLKTVGDRLGDYNSQLAVHIAGVQEARKHNELLEKGLADYKKICEERLQKLEAPHKWAAITYHGLKVFVLATGSVSAIYGAIKFLQNVGHS